MIRWFRRTDPEADLAAAGEAVPLPQQTESAGPLAEAPEYRLLPEPPDFAVSVAAAVTDGWHMAAVVTDTTGPDFYLRAITVRWPFLIARPMPSNRISDRRIDPADLSPTGSTPARKLVVNWGWVKLEDAFYQLRFYVRRAPTRLLGPTGRLKLRLTLKESAGGRRRIVVPVQSNAINWDAPDPQTPASPPQQST